MKTPSRGNFLAAGAKAAGLTLALAAALIVTPGPAPRAQTGRAPEAKPQEIKLGVKQRDKTSYLQIKLTDVLVSSVKATDSAGTRSLKRIDKLAIPCPDEQKECKTVELESGVLIGVCYCKDDAQTALLLPAVQKVREAAARIQSGNSSTSSHVKVFDGASGAEIRSGGSKPACWADEKLKLTICPMVTPTPK